MKRSKIDRKEDNEMSADDLLLAFQCCVPNARSKRDCHNCPLYGNIECHIELCELAIDYIMREKGKRERMNEYATSAIDAMQRIVSM